MDAAKNANKLTTDQEQYIRFLAAGKVDSTGKKWTKEDFATKILKVHPTTLSRWKHVPGFREALFDASVSGISEFIPDMIRAQVHKSIEKKDTVAFMALMRQTGLLKSDRIDHTTLGKEMPAPILGGTPVDATTPQSS